MCLKEVSTKDVLKTRTKRIRSSTKIAHNLPSLSYLEYCSFILKIVQLSVAHVLRIERYFLTADDTLKRKVSVTYLISYK